MNFQSTINQKVCGKLVAREIIGGPQTSLIEDLFRLKDEGADVDVPSFDERYTELFTADLSDGQWTGTDRERDEKIDELKELIDSITEKKDELADVLTGEDTIEEDSLVDDIAGYENEIETIESDITKVQDAEGEYPEIYEWWMVTDWFARKLKEKSEVVIEAYDNYYWGRQGSGQAILLDNVIGEIASDMGILDGQPDSWVEVNGFNI